MKNFLITILLLVSTVVDAQKHDNVWLMGYEDTCSQLTFTSSSVTIDTIHKGGMKNASICNTMCDSMGNLLFYTNGIWINNAQHQLMDNGDSLNPGLYADNYRLYGYPSTNNIIIIPHPNQPNKYYVFHISRLYGASGTIDFGEHLYYTLIDMNANNGLGRVEQKNQIIVSDSLESRKLQAVKHANGKDWWLLASKMGSNGFYTFLVAEDNITLVHEQYIGTTRIIDSDQGQSTFSLQGDKYIRYNYFYDLDIYDFDRCTGLLSNPIHIPIQDSSDISRSGGGVTVSPSGQYLYVGSFRDLYQFDLWATNVSSTKDTIAHSDNFYQFFPSNRPTFGYMQLAPDNKIYGVCHNMKYMNVIDYPDRGGDSCSIRQHGLDVKFINGYFMPNHPHYRTPVLSCDTTVLEVGVVEGVPDWGISLYPNPTDGDLTVSSNVFLSTTSIIEVYNTMGQLVPVSIVSSSQEQLEINTNNLPNGLYILRISSGVAVISKAFVVSQ